VIGATAGGAMSRRARAGMMAAIEPPSRPEADASTSVARPGAVAPNRNRNIQEIDGHVEL